MAALAPVRYPVVVGVIAFGVLNPDPAYAPTFQTAPEDRPSVLEQAGEVGLAIAAGAVITGLGSGATQKPPTFKEGSFSIIDWSGYPANMPRPTGPMRIISGEEYAVARAAANKANAAILKNAGLQGSGYHIHEIHPIQFGGSPTDQANKLLLPAAEHIGRGGVHSQFWTPLRQWITGK